MRRFLVLILCVVSLAALEPFVELVASHWWLVLPSGVICAGMLLVLPELAMGWRKR